MNLTRAGFGMVLVAATALAACDDTTLDAPAATVAAYAGPVGDSELALALTIDDGHVMAYVCGGETSFASDTHWFIGDADDHDIVLERDGWQLEVATGESARGTVRGPRGETHSFDIARVAAPLGLYRSAAGDGPCATGLVMWDDGGEVTTQGVWCDGAGRFGQVTPLAPMPFYDASGNVAVKRLAFESAEPQWLVPIPATR